MVFRKEMGMNVQSRSLNDENFSHLCRGVWLMGTDPTILSGVNELGISYAYTTTTTLYTDHRYKTQL